MGSIVNSVVQHAHCSVMKEKERIDILVNNAAFKLMGSAEETSIEA
jgi:short-subunit dehydrogenase